MDSGFPAFMVVFIGLGSFATVGAVIAALGVCGYILLLKRIPPRLAQNVAEMRCLGASCLAAVLGSLWLFTFPAYTGTTCTVSASSEDAPIRISRHNEVNVNGETIEVVRYSSNVSFVAGEGLGSCETRTSTMYETNGPRVIAPFTLPILVTLVPWVFYAVRLRPLVEAIAAVLLGCQMAIGMSMYGVAFAPSAFFMLLAALVALRSAKSMY